MYDVCFHLRLWNSQKQWLCKCVYSSNCLLGKWPSHSFEMPSIPRDFLNFRELISFCKSHDLILAGGGLFTASSRARTLASSCHSWFSSHKSWCVNWFSKKSAIALAFSDEWKLRPEGPWIAVGVLGPCPFRRDFAMGQIAWDVTSTLPIFVSHCSIAFLRVILLTDFVTQLTVVLHAGSLVSCHNFLNVSLFMSESVTLLEKWSTELSSR
jgi:hypothetical protein